MRLASKLLGSLLLGMALVATAARADDTATARVRFQEGVDLYDKGQYDKARAAFLQAWALKKHPAVLLNLAQSCLKSNHPGEAARFFTKYLREAPGITPQQKAEAEKGIAEARTKDGRLDVQGAAGVEVLVDEEPAGVLPLAEPYDVDPGAHTVRVKGEAEQKVTVGAGQTVTLKGGTATTTTTPGVTATAGGAGATAGGATTGAGGATTGATGATGGTDVRSGPGESCRARADCAEGLKCVARQCVDEREGRACEATSECGGLKCIQKRCTSGNAPPHGEGGEGGEGGGELSPSAKQWLGFQLEGTHPFVGLQWLGGPAWALLTTGSGSLNDRNVQGAFLFSLRGGVLFGRHELALELAPFTDLPYNLGSAFFRGAAFRVAGNYGYYIPLMERESFGLYWPIKVGVGMVAGANNSQGLVYFEGRGDFVGLAFRVGHLLIDFAAPSFRYAVTHRNGQAAHLMNWHIGGGVSYVF